MQIGKQIVVSTVDQIQNGQSPEFLKPLLTNPAAVDDKHRQQLETLVQMYPQCSVFRMLLAKAVQNTDSETAAKALQSAAVHTANREVLFRLIHQHELIIAPKQGSVYPPVGVGREEIVKPDASFTDEKTSEGTIFAENYPVEIINTAFTGEKSSTKENEGLLLEESYPEGNPLEEKPDAPFIGTKPAQEEAIAKDQPSAEKTDASFTGIKPEEEINEEENPSAENIDASFTGEKLLEEAFSAESLSINPNPEEDILIENGLRAEDVELDFVNEPVGELVFGTEEAVIEEETAPVYAAQEIDEEIYDEIIAIEDIRFEVVKTLYPEETAAETKAEEQPAFTIQDKAEKDMLSSIASIDYFTFNNKFGQNHTSPVNHQGPVAEIPAAAKATVPEVIEAQSINPSQEKEPETVSKYHDDKMPYTFMWWLDKTRKEYAETYQPYVKNFKDERNGQHNLSVGPELHRQYIESIFHDKPPLGLTENALPPVAQPTVKRKEDVLIERFIIEEPHIHPPSSEKLDTENKAKKSSEDADALVTETLAKIYLDQMLYHKALDTYKKLLLKFPEKSVYFAGQVESIEKKIN